MNLKFEKTHDYMCNIYEEEKDGTQNFIRDIIKSKTGTGVSVCFPYDYINVCDLEVILKYMKNWVTSK